ncbi:MAG: PEGA domain-containing protein [Patescibacteria group bacterium]
MKKILLILLGLVLLGIGAFVIFKLTTAGGGKAILKVNSTPEAVIFLNNQNIGKTPFEDKVDAGEYTLKLTVESSTKQYAPWEEKIKLTPNLLTYVNRNLGETEILSGGEVLTLEKISENEAQIAVVSTPDGATITVGGEEKGTTPKILQDLKPGSYELAVSSQGYETRNVKIKTTAGYKLNGVFHLIRAAGIGEETEGLGSKPDSSPTASPTTTPKPKVSSKPTPKASSVPSVTPKPGAKASPPDKPYVEILDTPTGFLRVRKEPNTSGEEIGRVSPGEYYSMLDEDNNGWYKIEYEIDKEGWISSQYAKKFE